LVEKRLTLGETKDFRLNAAERPGRGVVGKNVGRSVENGGGARFTQEEFGESVQIRRSSRRLVQFRRRRILRLGQE